MIKRIILSIIANSAGLYIVDYFLKDFCFLNAAAAVCPEKPEISLIAFVIGGILLGVLNTFVKPILKLISMPITFLTAGLFMFVVNGLVLGLLVWIINTLALENLSVLVLDGWITYIYAAVILGVFNILTHWLVKKH